MSVATRDNSLDDLLGGSPFLGYCYSYPHKTAYRPLAATPLETVWRDEPRDAMFLYLHLPFCEMRCGFCNLFTFSQPARELPSLYLQSLRRQAEAVVERLGRVDFARLALGGGTPTFLTLDELRHLGETVTETLGVDPGAIPVSCEASPATVDPAAAPGKLAWLREWGVDRISLGVQSWSEEDVRAMGRPQQSAQVLRSIEAIRDAGFPTLNLDLIYGGEGQTVDSWLQSVEQALAFQPEELYLYPLYVRPLTGLGRRARSWDDRRVAAYRAARDLLRERGYDQRSLRMFRGPRAPAEGGPSYRCQEDGMLGLGCGARSYTRRLHYSGAYAVGQRAIGRLIEQYVAAPPARFAEVDHGIALDAAEQRRRYLILSLLPAEGVSAAEYRERFGGSLEEDWPQLRQLRDRGLAERTEDRTEKHTENRTEIRWRLTDRGMEWSDMIGPWLYSPAVRGRMGEHAWS